MASAIVTAVSDSPILLNVIVGGKVLTCSSGHAELRYGFNLEK